MNTRTLKIGLIGNTNVGKSTLTQLVYKGEYNRKLEPTIGAESVLHNFNFNNSEQVRLQIWDLAGQERFDSLTACYTRTCQIILVAVDSSQSLAKESPERTRIEEILSQHKLSSSHSVMLVATKSDLAKDKPSEEVATDQQLENLAEFIKTTYKVTMLTSTEGNCFKRISALDEDAAANAKELFEHSVRQYTASNPTPAPVADSKNETQQTSVVVSSTSDMASQHATKTSAPSSNAKNNRVQIAAALFLLASVLILASVATYGAFGPGAAFIFANAFAFTSASASVTTASAFSLYAIFTGTVSLFALFRAKFCKKDPTNLIATASSSANPPASNTQTQSSCCAIFRRCGSPRQNQVAVQLTQHDESKQTYSPPTQASSQPSLNATQPIVVKGAPALTL